MNNLYLFFAMALCCCQNGFATSITAKQNGNWNNNSTWDLGRPPVDNDVVTIPANITVYLQNTPYPKNSIPDRPNLKINIYGIFDFSNAGSDKLYLNQGSELRIFAGGKIKTTNNGNEIIAIYNGSADNTVWNGNPSTVDGPKYASYTSVGFLNGVLPLTFVSFNVNNKNQTVDLTWVTNNERNTSHFEIEIKNHVHSDWKIIGMVKAAGNSNSKHTYSYSPSGVPPGVNEFRIKEVDNDGVCTYSLVKSFRLQTAKVIVAYNVHSKTLYIGDAFGARLELYDTNGIIKYTQTISSVQSNISLVSLKPGYYIATVSTNENEKTVQQVIIQ